MAGFVALVVILFTSLPRGGDRTSPPADQQEPTGLEPGAYALDLATGSTTRLPGDTGGWTEFDASPDGTELAFTSNATGTSQVQVMNVDGTGVRTVTHDPAGADYAAWSPDGSRIAYAGYAKGGTDRNVFVVDLASGARTQLTHERDDVYRMDWSPDGRRILYAVSIGSAPDPSGTGAGAIFQLRAVDVQTGEVRKLAGTHDELASEGTWSPDGNRIAFDRGTDSTTSLGFDPAEIWTMDANGANQERLISIDAPAIGASWSPDGRLIAYWRAEGADSGTYVVDVQTGEERRVGPGAFPTWLDSDTLIVEIL
jgi:Tol biopolymer transport system component